MGEYHPISAEDQSRLHQLSKKGPTRHLRWICGKFLEPKASSKVIYTDNSMDFGNACEDLLWNHCTSTPHRSEKQGFAERAVRRVREGTSAILLQSGLDAKCWANSMECYCYLRNVQDLLSEGTNSSCYEEPFCGPIIPF